MMSKWEYKIIRLQNEPKSEADDIFNTLRELGGEYWELVGVAQNTLFFKRQMEQITETFSHGAVINSIRQTTKRIIDDVIKSHLLPIMGQFPDIDYAIDKFKNEISNLY